MGDLLLFTPDKKSYQAKLENLLKAFLKNGLKISAKKCQLFERVLQYMGNTIFIKGRKMEPPTTPKDCRSFDGIINLLGSF